MITRTKTQNSRADFLPWAHVIFELTLVRESFRGSIIQNTKRVVVSRTRRDTRLLIEILDMFYFFVFVFFWKFTTIVDARASISFDHVDFSFFEIASSVFQ